MKRPKFNKNNLEIIKFVILVFFIWRLFIILPQFLAPHLFPLGNNFLGGGRHLFQSLPIFWSWLNFDGEHFISIAQNGYLPLTYFYFPGFPFLVKVVTYFIGNSFTLYAVSGLIISNMSFFLALIGIYKVSEIETDKDIAKHTLVLLLAFPFSFFFAAYYSESLFLCLTVWSYYFVIRDKYFIASILSGMGGFTRLVGIATPFGLIFANRPKDIFKKLLIFILSLWGIIVYMIYLLFKTGNPLSFMQSVEIFGSQRSSHLVMLPQVFYRYVFKILPAANGSLTNIYIPWIEFLVAVILLLIVIYGIKHISLKYWIFMFLVYLIPTTSGSFSSLPRYAIINFPAFIICGMVVSKSRRSIQILTIVIEAILLVFTESMFVQGIFVS